MEDAFYDLVYEAWRRGKDPNAVTIDNYDYYRSKGYAPDEISLDMVYPTDRSSRKDEP